MSNKIIFIILDGLNYKIAHDYMGYLQALIEDKQCILYKQKSELPSISRPIYECLLTGITPVKSGIINNSISRLSNQQSIFSLAKNAGLTTAAVAYSWVSELYNRTPYQTNHRFTNDINLNIQHGLFYNSDYYPSDHVFIDAEYLRHSYSPNFLLIHPMSIDTTGHLFGINSSEYHNEVRSIDNVLSEYIGKWLEHGYQIIITSDHGMTADKNHGGILKEEREVPLYLIGESFSKKLINDNLLWPKQTELCGIICTLLGLKHNKASCESILCKTT